MKDYLKMADVLPNGVAVSPLHSEIQQQYADHAINSHDELVQMNQELLAALEAVIDDKAPLYHDCIDNGESECGWCIARKAIAKAKGGAA